jgi:serine protease Do
MKTRNMIRLLLPLLCLLALPAATSAQQPAPDLQAQIASERRSVIVEAVQKVSPSVASVVVSGIQRVPLFNDPFYREFFGLGPTRRQRITVQSGSAVMISAAGEFLTNQHVVAGADAMALLLPNGETRPAELVGVSSKLDLALLRTDPQGLEPAPLGGSSDLMVGEWLVAVGYPVGGREVTGESRFRPTVTVGVVSALERSFTPSRRTRGREQLFYPDMIQTDAAINPGNSGGPLANASGEIVGINTFILTESGGSQGLGFAIPIERALKAAAEMRDYGRVRDADFTDLTVYLEMSAADAAALGLEEPRGLRVQNPGVVAEAGLREDDVILDVDGKRVDTMEEAQLALIPRFVGDRVILGVWRGSSRIEIPFILTEAIERR